jgi:phosphinothricin acetyltransferase
MLLADTTIGLDRRSSVKARLSVEGYGGSGWPFQARFSADTGILAQNRGFSCPTEGFDRVPDAAIAIRLAQPADAAAIAAIYNQGIRDRVATLETEERSAEERAGWLASRDERHPVYVAELDGGIVAWGSLNAFNPRPAYQWVVDFSVYVDSARRGHGLGGAMLDHLITEATRLGYHKLVLAAFPFNQAGMRLYESRGFRTVGIYHEQGQLDGRWVDTIIMERMLEE